MSPDFEQFSRRLDEEWRRERLRTRAPQLITPSERAALTEELDRADPLGSPALGAWLVGVREALQPWPARLAFATAACAILVVGFIVGRTMTGPSPTRLAGGQIPATSIEIPPYHPEVGGRALGIGAPVKPESEAKFREAMAFHDTPEFGTRALPLLREAVSLDPRNDQAQFWLGVTLLLSEKISGAIAPLEEATRLAPANRTYKQYLLYAYLRTGDGANALRLQTQLLKQP